jgi:HEAT repeat protein
MEIDSDQTAALIAKLDHDDKPTIRAAVDALILLAAGSSELCSVLNRRLAEAGHKHYWPVAYVLGNLPQPSRAVITGLLDALDHREPDIRWAVSLLLARIAKDNPDLINLLIQLCATGSDNQKRMALYCLRDLALSDTASLTALLAALRDHEPTVRVAAAICLKARPDIDDAGKNILMQAYSNDAESRVRHAAAIALANLGSPAAEFLIALKKNSESKNKQTKKAAVAALELLKKRRSAPSGSASDR